MYRVLYAIIVGLAGAALLHIVIVLALPHAGNRDAFSRVLAAGPPQQFNLYRDAEGDNPLMQEIVCAFDASLRPVHLQAAGQVPFWSLTVHNSDNDEIFSMNDRTAAEGVLDVAIATPAGTAAMRRNMPAALDKAIIIETAMPDGYAVLRVLVPAASFRQKAEAFIKSARCSTLQRF